MRLATHKYHAHPVDADGYHFDSLAEFARYGELRLLERVGEIADLRVHPRYTLQEAFRDRMGKRWPAIVYVADFEYREDGRTILEDVKGMETRDFKIKRKLFLRRYPDLELRVIAVGRR